jgi:hypothetical protein
MGDTERCRNSGKYKDDMGHREGSNPSTARTQTETQYYLTS